jgi:CheY-like chemotaxis protein
MQAQQILFVEDDVLTGVSTCQFMRDQGVRVLDADCAQGAIEVLGRRGYLSGLVTDIDLGDGEDGFDIARHTRLAYPHLPVVFVSGTAAARHAAEGVEGSVFINKPYHPRQIIEALTGLSGGKGPAPCAFEGEGKAPSAGIQRPLSPAMSVVESNEINAL